MKKIFLAVLNLAFSFLMIGCIVFQKVSYDIKLETKDKGIATITFYDIRSDAIGKKEFDEDKKQLFEYIYKSPDFIAFAESEGKFVTSRRLFIENKKLNGEATFVFKKLKNVESRLMFQDGYFFITLEAQDSILSTNGIVISSKNYKRIMWEANEKNLKFEMLSDVKTTSLKELSPFFNEDVK